MCKPNRLFITILVFLFTGCARLPDYALPQQINIENTANLSTEGMPYRTLEITHFRATAIPGNTNTPSKHLSAKICTQIRLAERTTFRIEPKPDQSDSNYYGKVENIAFEAVMLPYYSWWSPKVPPFSRPYTLQHEQIHFAITALYARRLSRDSRTEMQNFTVVDTTRNGAQEQLGKKIATLIQGALDEEMQKQLTFDQETSLHFAPEKQQEWFEDITIQLQNITVN